MSKPNEDMAAEILIAALNAHAIHPNTTRTDENARQIGEAYKLILERINQATAPPGRK